ncbi:hypothetical protein BJY52DRAFT_1215392 [Lactarius psammicola]|nr:hypothetical protein BJY52DRAFT_1215392 [Lactarius psammicola]
MPLSQDLAMPRATRATHPRPPRRRGRPSALDTAASSTFEHSPDYFSKERLFAKLDKKILSKKRPTNWIGKRIAPGMIGLINHGEMPKLLTKPGRYPRFPAAQLVGRARSRGRADGLTVVQVSQNQAAVISDPENTVFVLKNPGFVAYCVTGSYDVLDIVDQTRLPDPIKDRVTGAILGHKFESGNDFKQLSSGQHYITCPNVTLRGLYTLSENQFEMPMKDIFTRDQVPVSLKLYLKWRLEGPVKLAKRGYETPYDMLRDKAQSYLDPDRRVSSMVKQRSIGGDGTMGSEKCGIILERLTVIDSEVASTLDKLTKGALQAQVEAANLDRENRNKVKQEEGALSVARIKAQAPTIDAEEYSTVTVTVSGEDSTQLEAEAEVRRLKAEARRLEAEAKRLEAEAKLLEAARGAGTHRGG